MPHQAPSSRPVGPRDHESHALKHKVLRQRAPETFPRDVSVKYFFNNIRNFIIDVPFQAVPGLRRAAVNVIWRRAGLARLPSGGQDADAAASVASLQ